MTGRPDPHREIPEGYELVAVPTGHEFNEYLWLEDGQVMHWIVREQGSGNDR